MVVLQAKLLELKRQQEQATIDALKGDTAGSWGNQMRSYVLHPYQMVKDLRTETETGNVSAVLDGDLDEFSGSWDSSGGVHPTAVAVNSPDSACRDVGLGHERA